MSNNKTASLQRLADMFKALANPHRLHIFLRLISCCPPGTRYNFDSEAGRYVGQLAEEVNVAPSTVSHHIKELRNAGLIKAVRRGKNIECWMDPDAVKELVEVLLGRFPVGLLGDETLFGQTQVQSAGHSQDDATLCCCNPASDPVWRQIADLTGGWRRRLQTADIQDANIEQRRRAPNDVSTDRAKD
jgi:ArsR family transcriptional regulator